VWYCLSVPSVGISVKYRGISIFPYRTPTVSADCPLNCGNRSGCARGGETRTQVNGMRRCLNEWYIRQIASDVLTRYLKMKSTGFKPMHEQDLNRRVRARVEPAAPGSVRSSRSSPSLGYRRLAVQNTAVSVFFGIPTQP
jgi:hypothetical protein